ncbi:extracellular solute-binding protein [Longispora sp. NPDC051575]|uniref:extracellular solute-binding protein n=1 Tax=Longispora sp. NPDC051575 TaxID=3154943 RepID=UPI00343D122D
MKIVRWAALVAAGALLAACAPPSAAPQKDAGVDEKTGALRVWLFQEPNQPPKEKVVKEAVDEFTAAHKGVTVEITYIPTNNTRHEKFKGAFSDPASAPDVAEYGNTDVADYVAAGGFADLTKDVTGGDISKDLLGSATIDGKLYGLPWYVGLRALYYRTDVFTELNIAPPTSYAELAAAATRIRAAKPELYGIAVGGEYTFGALPFVWDAGGDVAAKKDGKYTGAISSPESRAGVKAYTDLFATCPAQACAGLTGGKTAELFATGKAGMAILGNFNKGAVEAGAAKGKYAVVPLPGAKPGSVAPAFAGGNNLGVLKGTKKRSLAVEFTKLLGGQKYQTKMYEAMGNLPTSSAALADVAGKDAFLKPFLATASAGTRFVPLDPAWVKVDSQKVIPTMLQKIVTGQASVDKATEEANTAINGAFGR